MKDKLQGLLGVGVIAFILFGIGKSIYKRNFDDFVEVVHSPQEPISKVENALFWVEEELEKTAGAPISGIIGQEASEIFNPLYKSLSQCGMLGSEIKTMSPQAVEEWIKLDAYRGSEPDVWLMATEENIPYILKAMITKASSKRNNLLDVDFLFSLYEVKSKKLIWEVKAERISGFIMGRSPDAEKLVDHIMNSLKASGILASDCSQASK